MAEPSIVDAYLKYQTGPVRLPHDLQLNTDPSFQFIGSVQQSFSAKNLQLTASEQRLNNDSSARVPVTKVPSLINSAGSQETKVQITTKRKSIGESKQSGKILVAQNSFDSADESVREKTKVKERKDNGLILP